MKLKTAVIALLMCALCMPASAESYLYDAHGKSKTVPDAYVTAEIRDGAFDRAGKLRNPSDIYVDAAGDIYIADTGNDRVVVFTGDWAHKRTIHTVMKNGEARTLIGPKGVFGDGSGLIYIADTGGQRIVAVDASDVVVREMTRENVPAVNENITFQPEKVAVDTDGNVFVVDRSVYQGILQYGPDDAFIGFYAPNEVTVTAGVLFLRTLKSLFSDERADSLEKILPIPYSNVYIDGENLVYTAAHGVPEGTELKRLNTMGINILKSAGSDSRRSFFGDQEIAYENNKAVTSKFIDIHADRNGLIAGADETKKRLFVYDLECNLIAIADTGCRALAAIDKRGDDYLALDSDRGAVTVLSPTPYMKDVLEALVYYGEGRYEESVALWENVLEQNAHFPIACRSIGRASFQAGDNRKAMTMLKKGDDPYFYSLALKDYRREFVRRYFILLAALAFVTVVGMIFGIKYLRRWLMKGGKKAGRL